MSEHHIKLNIGSKAELTAFDKVKSAVRSLAQSVKDTFKGIGSNLMNIKAGFEMVAGACQKVYGAFKKAFDFQTMTSQFKYLIGTMDEAREHMEMLKELGATPPFSMEEFAAASRQMILFTDGALGFKDSLELIGDVAAATGKPVEEVGTAVAKLYSNLRDGEDIKRAANQLKNMGAISPKVVAELENMQKAGADSVAIWNKLEEELGKFKGAMEASANTANGAIGALKSAFDDAIRDLGESTSDALTGPLNDLTEWIRDLEENGTLEEWGAKIANVMSGVAKSIGWVVDGLSAVYDHLKEGASSEPIQQQFDEKASWELLNEEKINPYKTKRTYRTADGSIAEEYEVNNREERKWLREKEKMEKKAAEEEKKLAALKEADKTKQAKKAEEERTKAAMKAHEEYMKWYEQMEKEAQEDAERPFKEAEAKSKAIMTEAYKRAAKAKDDKSANIIMETAKLATMKNEVGLVTDENEKAKKVYEIAEQTRKLSNLIKEQTDEERKAKSVKKLEDIDAQLEKLNKKEKELTVIVNGNGEDQNNGHDLTTGQGRHDAKVEAKERRRQENRERHREQIQRNRENRLVRDYRFNRHALTDKQQEEARGIIRRRRAEQELNKTKKEKEKLEKEKQKELDENTKQLPNNVKSIKDNIDTFLNVNKVK